MRKKNLLLSSIVLSMLLASGVAFVGVSLVAPVSPAQATFPGENGRIVFVSNRNTPQNTNPEGDLEIFTMNADGSGLDQLTNNGASDSTPNYSPDGKKIVFTSHRSDESPEIYLMNADGSDETRITYNHVVDTDPSFSPDGKKIVFQSDQYGNSGEILVMNADGSGTSTNLSQNQAYDTDPAVSPDGKIAFATLREDTNPAGDPNFEIYTMNADGSNPTNITNNRAWDSFPNVSPDGKQITFHSKRDGNFEVYKMSADGSNLTRLTYQGGGGPVFSPDGKQIVFARNGEIYVMNVDGSSQTRLTDNSATDGYPDWQPIPVSAGPTSKAECKNGGYMEFGFASQGRCIAFLNRAAHKQTTRTHSVVGDTSATQNHHSPKHAGTRSGEGAT